MKQQIENYHAKRNKALIKSEIYVNTINLLLMLTQPEINQLLFILHEHTIPFDLLEFISDTDYYAIKFRYEPFIFKIRDKNKFLRGRAFNLKITPEDEFPRPLWLNWKGVLNNFQRWSGTMRKHLSTPALWTETAQLLAVPDAPNEKFTSHELRELQSWLRTVEQRLTTSSLPEAAIKELTAALRDNAPKAESMTKREWQKLFITTIVSTLTGLALSTEHVNTVCQILKAAFTGWLLP